MHQFAHGEVPNKIIEVDAHIVESFLGRIEDPQKAKDNSLNIINDPAFRAVMVIGLRSVAKNQNDPPEFKSSFFNYSREILKLLKVYEGTAVKKNRELFFGFF